MALRLKRLLGPAIALSPGEWSSETASGAPCVSCPRCGELDDIDPSTVDAQGRLATEWQCSQARCGHRQWLELEAYAEEVLT